MGTAASADGCSFDPVADASVRDLWCAPDGAGVESLGAEAEHPVCGPDPSTAYSTGRMPSGSQKARIQDSLPSAVHL